MNNNIHLFFKISWLEPSSTMKIELSWIPDAKLRGASELYPFYKLIIICSFHPARNNRKWLAAPDSSRNKNEARDKRQVDTLRLVSRRRAGSVCGKKTLGFFGLRESVCFSLHRFWICMFIIYNGMRLRVFYGKSPLPERSNIAVVPVLGFSINSLRQLSRLELHTSSRWKRLSRKTYNFTANLSEASCRSFLTHGTSAVLPKSWRICTTDAVEKFSNHQTKNFHNVLRDNLDRFSQAYIIMIGALYWPRKDSELGE